MTATMSTGSTIFPIVVAVLVIAVLLHLLYQPVRKAGQIRELGHLFLVYSVTGLVAAASYCDPGAMPPGAARSPLVWLGLINPCFYFVVVNVALIARSRLRAGQLIAPRWRRGIHLLMACWVLTILLMNIL